MLAVLFVLSAFSALLQQGGPNCVTHSYFTYASFDAHVGDTLTLSSDGNIDVWLGTGQYYSIDGTAAILINSDTTVYIEAMANKHPTNFTVEHCSAQPPMQLPFFGLAGLLPLFIFLIVIFGIGAMFRGVR